MPNLVNIQTPIDLFGSLVTPRHKGEDAVSYRRRVLEVMGAMTHRDRSRVDWVRYRETELSGHTGHPVRLISGARDAELLDEAERQMLTLRRIGEIEGPFRWPDYGPAGERTLYNAALPAGSGVTTPDDLVPGLAEHEGQRRLALRPGHCVIEGEVWYIPARTRRLSVPLPPHTNKTAIVPVQLLGQDSATSHPHRFVAVDAQTVRAVGADGHRHLLHYDGNVFTFEDVDGGHNHTLRSVDTSGILFMAMGPPDPEAGYPGMNETVTGTGRRSTFDGLLGLPVTSFGGIEVKTEDGTHSASIDPHAYWSGDYYLPGPTHGHHVINGEVQPGGSDGHVHTIKNPDRPDARPMIPHVMAEDESAGTHPGIAYLHYEHGFLVAENDGGLTGDNAGVLALVFGDSEALVVPEVPPVRTGEVLGIGPDVPATSIWADVATSVVPGNDLVFKVRSEDRFTGGVPYQYVEAQISGGPGGPLSDARACTVTGADAYGEIRLRVPASALTGRYRVDLFLGSDAEAEHVAEYLVTIAGAAAGARGVEDEYSDEDYVA